MELIEGDWLFARDKDSDGDPLQDMIQAFVSEWYYYPLVILDVHQIEFIISFMDTEMVNLRLALANIHIRVMGERHDRDPQQIWYEKQSHAKAVKLGQRCYGFSSMVEKPRGSEGPPGALKTVDNNLDDVQIVVRDTLKVRHINCFIFYSTNSD